MTQIGDLCLLWEPRKSASERRGVGGARSELEAGANKLSPLASRVSPLASRGRRRRLAARPERAPLGGASVAGYLPPRASKPGREWPRIPGPHLSLGGASWPARSHKWPPPPPPVAPPASAPVGTDFFRPTHRRRRRRRRPHWHSPKELRPPMMDGQRARRLHWALNCQSAQKGAPLVLWRRVA